MSTETPPTDELRAALKRAVRKISALEAELASTSRRAHEPIAIVGLGCRLPGDVTTPGEFWELLRDARHGIVEVPEDRPQLRAVMAQRPAFRSGGFLRDVDCFDAQFFGISPREAAWIDPQQRLLLEVCSQAIEHAGQIADELAGTRTGVFFGMISSEGYLEATREASRVAPDIYAATGATLSVAAGRIAYTLGLHGPALVVDTACSSSLVAVHLACRSLRDGECNAALAGGISLMLSGHDARLWTTSDALAADGRCRAFDAHASGLVLAEGCGVVVLKRLSDAQANGDRVLALIRGSALNQDGRSAGLTAPSLDAQEDVLRRALQDARVEAAAIDFVETHGTGTALGDPIELEALTRVFGGSSSASAPPCILGALKTNLGHTEAAAGIAGLIKTVLALEHETIPANLHFSTLNTRASLTGTRLRIPTTNLSWARGERPRRAGVSSFGMSGTNAHVILEEAPASSSVPAADGGERDLHVLLVSAREQDRLREQAGRYADYLDDPARALADVCYSAARRCSTHDVRLAVVARSRQELTESLRAYQRDQARPGLVSGRVSGFHRPKLVFVFPGQGSQWLGMGRQLYAREPAFRAVIDACAAAAARHSDVSLLDALLTAEDGSQLERTWVLQPLLLSLELGLAALWQHWGVVPDTVVGASMGEVAAAHVAGVLSLEDAVAITCKRSGLLRQLEGRGAMALTELSFEAAERWLAGYDGRISIASSNSPRSTVLTGEREALQDLLAKLEAQRLFCRWVNAKGAGHSPQVDEILGALSDRLGTIVPEAGRIPVYSSVEGRILPGAAFDREYWLRNVRQTVRFSRACEALVEGGHALFLEVSPHPILSPSIHQVAEKLKRSVSVIGSLYRNKDEQTAMLEALASLHCQGYVVDWSKHYPQGRLVSLPAYPFRRERHWMELPAANPGTILQLASSRSREEPGHPLVGAGFRMAHPATARYWQRTLALADLPYLADHRIEQTIVLPATAVIEMACAVAREVLDTESVVLEDLFLKETLVLTENVDVTVQIVLEELGADAYGFRLAHRLDDRDAAESWRLLATCTLRPLTDSDRGESAQAQAQTRTSSSSSRAELRSHELAATPVDVDNVYAGLAAVGGKYGPAFRGLTAAWSGPCVARVEVTLPANVPDHGYTAHPALLDACLHALAVAELSAHARTEQACVPVAIERVIVHAALPRSVSCEARIDAASVVAEGFQATLTIHDPQGLRLLTLEGLQVLQLAAASAEPARDQLGFESAWRPAPAALAELPVDPGRWLILADAGGVGAVLREQLERAGGQAECAYLDRGACAETELANRVGTLLEAALRAPSPLRGIVHLWGLDDAPVEEMRHGGPAERVGPTEADASGQRPAAASCGPTEADAGRQGPAATSCGSDWIGQIGQRGWLSALHLARALGSQQLRDWPRLCLVTQRTQAVAGDEALAPEQALLWGLGGTIRSEHPGWQVRRVDVDALDSAPSALARELFAADDEDQVAYRRGQRFAARLVPVHAATTEFRAEANATYLVTGGMSGLGFSAARWLAARGAGHLLLLGRRVPVDRAELARLHALEELGSRVTLVECDVSDAQRLAEVIAQYAHGSHPLRGIIHSAGVLQDGLLARQSASSFQAVMRAKVGGAWLLHALTRELPLQVFVLYSSLASLMGSAGQANYVAANAFLDTLAQHRRRSGLPALSINWGPFAEVGRATDKQLRGLRGLTERDGHALLDEFIASDSAQRAGVGLNLPELLDFYPHLARWPYLEELALVAPPTAAGDPQLLAALRSGDHAQRSAKMRDYLRRELSRVLRMDPERIDDQAPLNRLGLDSLMGLELRRRLEAGLGVALQSTLVWTYPTLHAVSEYLVELVEQAPVREQPAVLVDPLPARTDEERASDLAALSDEQLWDLTSALVG